MQKLSRKIEDKVDAAADGALFDSSSSAASSVASTTAPDPSTADAKTTSKAPFSVADFRNTIGMIQSARRLPAPTVPVKSSNVLSSTAKSAVDQQPSIKRVHSLDADGDESALPMPNLPPAEVIFRRSSKVARTPVVKNISEATITSSYVNHNNDDQQERGHMMDQEHPSSYDGEEEDKVISSQEILNKIQGDKDSQYASKGNGPNDYVHPGDSKHEKPLSVSTAGTADIPPVLNASGNVEELEDNTMCNSDESKFSAAALTPSSIFAARNKLARTPANDCVNEVPIKFSPGAITKVTSTNSFKTSKVNDAIRMSTEHFEAVVAASAEKAMDRRAISSTKKRKGRRKSSVRFSTDGSIAGIISDSPTEKKENSAAKKAPSAGATTMCVEDVFRPRQALPRTPKDATRPSDVKTSTVATTASALNLHADTTSPRDIDKSVGSTDSEMPSNLGKHVSSQSISQSNSSIHPFVDIESLSKSEAKIAEQAAIIADLTAQLAMAKNESSNTNVKGVNSSASSSESEVSSLDAAKGLAAAAEAAADEAEKIAEDERAARRALEKEIVALENDRESLVLEVMKLQYDAVLTLQQEEANAKTNIKRRIAEVTRDGADFNALQHERIRFSARVAAKTESAMRIASDCVHEASQRICEVRAFPSSSEALSSLGLAASMFRETQEVEGMPAKVTEDEVQSNRGKSRKGGNDLEKSKVTGKAKTTSKDTLVKAVAQVGKGRVGATVDLEEELDDEDIPAVHGEDITTAVLKPCTISDTGNALGIEPQSKKRAQRGRSQRHNDKNNAVNHESTSDKMVEKKKRQVQSHKTKATKGKSTRKRKNSDDIDADEELTGSSDAATLSATGSATQQTPGAADNKTEVLNKTAVKTTPATHSDLPVPDKGVSALISSSSEQVENKSQPTRRSARASRAPTAYWVVNHETSPVNVDTAPAPQCPSNQNVPESSSDIIPASSKEESPIKRRRMASRKYSPASKQEQEAQPREILSASVSDPEKSCEESRCPELSVKASKVCDLKPILHTS